MRQTVEPERTGRRPKLPQSVSRHALLALGALILVYPDGQVMAQIDQTKHDLTGGGIDELCVFCHTPHASNAEIEAPLWNRLTSQAAYTTYDSSTIDGDILPVGSVSAACLSCHDGTQSTDVVINGPGTGQFDNQAGIALRGGDRFLDDPTKAFALGTDLSNDHPIGVQYGGFGTPPVDPDFRTLGNGLQVASINGANRWWVDTEATPNGQRNKTDMILYTRANSSAGGLAEPFVECGSCHDPHEAGNDLFLRRSNAASGVCLACHIK